VTGGLTTFATGNTYTGPTTFGGGTLEVGTVGALGSGTLNFTGGTLRYGTGVTTDFSYRFNSTGNQSLNIDTNGQNVSYAYALVGTGSSLALSDSDSGTGTLALAASNSYTAGTTVNGGNLVANAAGAFGTGNILVNPTGTGPASLYTYAGGGAIASNAAVVVNSYASPQIGTLYFNDSAPVIGSLAGTGNVVLASGTALTTGNATNTVFSGVISDGCTLTNSGSLTVTGSGTFTLSGASTYFGSTNVSGGTLDVTGALANSPVITVNAATSPATLILDGAGALPSAAAITGTAGSSIPTVTVNSNQSFASLTNAGTTNFNAVSTTIGTIANTGTTNVSSAATLNATSAFSEGLVNNAGTININGGLSNVIGQGNGTGTGTTGFTSGGVTGTGTLSVSSGAQLHASHISQSVLNIDATSTVTIADSSAPGNNASVSVLTDLNNSGTLDLKNNSIVINDGTQFVQLQSAMASAYDGGLWDQKGLTSSSAAAQYSSANGTNAYGLAYETGTEIAAARANAGITGPVTVDGQTVASTAIAVKYTLVGDTTLTGQVGESDFLTVQSNLDGLNTDWSQGNFHYGTGSDGTNESDLLETQANLDGTASGNLVAGSAVHSNAVSSNLVTRSLSVSPDLDPVAPSGALQLVVNPSNGNVSIVNTASTPTAFTSYNIKVLDGTSNVLLVGNPADIIANEGGTGNPPDTGELVLADTHVGGANYNVNAASYGSSPAAWSLSLDGENGGGNGFGLAEGPLTFTATPTRGSVVNTLTIPAGQSISLGSIFSTLGGVSQTDLSFFWTPEDAAGGDTSAGYTQAPEYLSTPEPASLGILGLGGVMMMRRRRSGAKK
jgi:autotransporter-associated beta strand protein